MTASSKVSATSPNRSTSPRSFPFRYPRLTATTSPRQARTRPGMTDQACLGIWKQSTSKPTNRRRRCGCWCKTYCGPTATAGSTPESSPAAHLRQGDHVQVALSGVSGKISRIVVAGEDTRPGQHRRVGRCRARPPYRRYPRRHAGRTGPSAASHRSVRGALDLDERAAAATRPRVSA